MVPYGHVYFVSMAKMYPKNAPRRQGLETKQLFFIALWPETEVMTMILIKNRSDPSHQIQKLPILSQVMAENVSKWS